jgi:hypothetical protein
VNPNPAVRGVRFLFQPSAIRKATNINRRQRSRERANSRSHLPFKSGARFAHQKVAHDLTKCHKLRNLRRLTEIPVRAESPHFLADTA